MKDSQLQCKQRAIKNQRDKLIEKFLGNENNQFSQQDKLSFDAALFRLREKLRNKDTNLTIPNIGTVNFGNPQGLKHYVSKAVLTYTLLIKKQHCSTEVLDTDLYWIERDLAIEIERNYTPKVIEEKTKKFKNLFFDVIIIDLSLIPNDFNEMQKYFIERLGI